MASLFDDRVADAVQARLASLGPDSPRRWGRMDVGQMVQHCAEGLRLALGESTARPLGNALSHTVVKWLGIYLVPWPKGRLPTAPELVRERPVPPGELERDVATLAALVRRVHDRGRDGPWFPHPLFGSMTGRDWGVLAFRHLDHHLRQFGA